jgi:lia operon protein LiaG
MKGTRTGRWVVAATMLAAPAWLGAQESFRVGGQEVSVYNLAGHVEVVAGSGSEVVVHVTRGGSDGARLEVDVGTVRGREALRIIYPDDRIVYPEMGRGSRSNLRVRDDGTFYGDGSRGNRVEIRGSGSGLEAWADLVVEVPAGRDFALYLATGNIEARSVSGDFRLDTGSGSVDARDVTGSLDVDTGSGRVDAAGVRGSLRIDTGSGSVTVEDVVGDDVDIDTGSGGVRGRGLESVSLRVDTGSGSIELDEVAAADVVLDTGSGGVELMLLTDVEVLDVDTGSGSVTIHAPADLGGELEIETGSGGIDLDFPVEARVMRRNHVRGSLGDGLGRIRIDTGSGGVRLIRN